MKVDMERQLRQNETFSPTASPSADIPLINTELEKIEVIILTWTIVVFAFLMLVALCCVHWDGEADPILIQLSKMNLGNCKISSKWILTSQISLSMHKGLQQNIISSVFVIG